MIATQSQETNKHCENETIKIIAESLFRETTRSGGQTKRMVYLVLTSKILTITSCHSFASSTPKSSWDSENIFEVQTLYPLNTVKLSIFKKSRRQILKLCYDENCNRYFELEKSHGRHNEWAMWCKSVLQLSLNCTNNRGIYVPNTTGYDLSIFNKQWEPQKFCWRDKYLYLGSRREIEDSSRPTPLPGLGPADDIKKLLYLKPQYFGCWDQSEHWVQCESSKLLKCIPTATVIGNLPEHTD